MPTGKKLCPSAALILLSFGNTGSLLYPRVPKSLLSLAKKKTEGGDDLNTPDTAKRKFLFQHKDVFVLFKDNIIV